ncbi:Telomerase reverse transcriptase, partial [Lachnellula suecica]
KPLYFAKIDVTAAFDTIPQDAVLALMRSLPSEEQYAVRKQLRVTPNTNYRLDKQAKPSRKYTSAAYPLSSSSPGIPDDKKNAIFVQNIVPRTWDTAQLLQLLSEHVTQNIVKIGKKYYRQAQGIPQGSVLSSLLCNYFYADLEANHLSFLDASESLLMRLTDDSLLITTNPEHARRFLQVMHAGLPAYGVTVRPEKTLVNFEVEIQGKPIKRVRDGNGGGFPYVGCTIDMRTLELSRDRGRNPTTSLGDSMTVEFSKVPGKSFYRKVLNKLKAGTYDHRLRRIGHPVRSAIHKPQIGRLVVGWVTTSEYLLLYVYFLFFFFLAIFCSWFIMRPGANESDSLKIQLQPMYHDTSHNSLRTVHSNISSAFVETAEKLYVYAKLLPVGKRPGFELMKKTIDDSIELAYVLMKSKACKKGMEGYKCRVSKDMVEWLALNAFLGVLRKRQSRYGSTVAWLKGRVRGLKGMGMIGVGAGV